MKRSNSSPIIVPAARRDDGGRRSGARLVMAAVCWLLAAGGGPAAWAGDGWGTNTGALSGSSAANTNLFNVVDDKYRLAIGDQLNFRIIEDEDDSRILVVTDSGDVQVPYVGRFPALGKTCKQLAAELKPELEKKYYKQATVIIAVDSKPRSRGKIYVVGAVASPGAQDITGDEELTAGKAVLRAGGLNDFADGTAVRVTRSTNNKPGEEKTFTVNVRRVFKKGKLDDDLVLLPGDLVYVPERMIRF